MDPGVQLGGLRLDLIQMLVKRSLINAASPEQGQHPVPVVGLLFEGCFELTELLLTPSPLLVIHRQALAELLDSLSRVTQERFDIGPHDLFDVVAVDVLGQASLAVDSVESTGELPSVAAIIMIPLPARHGDSRESQSAQAALDQASQQ